MVTENTKELFGKDSDFLAAEAVKLLSEKLALDITMFEVSEFTSVTDFYVNATGKSQSHVLSLADDLSENFSDRGVPPLRVEGRSGRAWILVDFGQLIVNIFDAESRSFYSMDRFLPAESKRDVSELLSEVDKKFGGTTEE